MKNNLLRFFLFCSVLFCSEFLSAQSCNVHDGVLGIHNPNNASGPQIGQTFLACGNGDVTAVLVGFQDGSVGNFDLFLEIEPGSGNYITSNLVATLNIGSPLATDQMMTFNLATPFAVVDDGTVYRIAVQANPSGTNNLFVKGSGNSYSGGVYVSSDGGHLSSIDLSFQVEISPASSGSPAGIPTLSEWGLLILALMLMTLGTVYLLQPQWREGLNKNS